MEERIADSKSTSDARSQTLDLRTEAVLGTLKA